MGNSRTKYQTRKMIDTNMKMGSAKSQESECKMTKFKGISMIKFKIFECQMKLTTAH